MANLKVKSEGDKFAKKVMDFIGMNSFEPIYEAIGKNEYGDAYLREIRRCFPTGEIINELDERGELYEAYKEYVGLNGISAIKDMTNKKKLELVSGLFDIPYLASPEEYGEAIAKAVREQYYR